MPIKASSATLAKMMVTKRLLNSGKPARSVMVCAAVLLASRSGGGGDWGGAPLAQQGGRSVAEADAADAGGVATVVVAVCWPLARVELVSMVVYFQTVQTRVEPAGKNVGKGVASKYKHGCK